MSKLYHFFRLVRGLNLLVIAFTMYAVQYFVSNYSDNIQAFELEYFLLVLSVVLIAAAGNIINDYFDVKADRVNKPDRLIIDKHIKRRWGIMFNWMFNFIGFSLAMYLSFRTGQYLIVLLASFTIVLLWLYSMVLKKKALVGNVSVALMVALVPFYSLLFYTNEFNFMEVTSFSGTAYYVVIIVSGFAGCAFFINLLREVTKDLSDIIGDKRIDATTYPIKYGLKSTKVLLVVISVIYIAFLLVLYMKLNEFLFVNAQDILGVQVSFAAITGVLITFVLTFLIGLLVTIFSKSLYMYRVGSNLYKIAMLAGVSLILFL